MKTTLAVLLFAVSISATAKTTPPAAETFNPTHITMDTERAALPNLANTSKYTCTINQFTWNMYLCWDSLGYYPSTCYCPRGGGAAIPNLNGEPMACSLPRPSLTDWSR